MTGIEAIASVSAQATGAIGLVAPSPMPLPTEAQASGSSFADLMIRGLQRVDERVSTADRLVREFALDDTVPLHQVTYALEEARLSVELAMQVQTRLIEGYRQLMNMQL